MLHTAQTRSGPRWAAIGDLDNEQWLRLLLTAARGGLWELDFLSRQVRLSPEMYELCGLDPAPAAPLNYQTLLTEIVHPADQEVVQATLQRMQVGGELGRAFQFEHRILRPDGAIIWVISLAHVEQDEHGRPITAHGMSRDITARKQIEQIQKERDQFIRNVTDLTPDVVFVLEVEPLTTIYMNRKLHEELGYGDQLAYLSPDELADRTMHPDDLARRPALVSAAEALTDNDTMEYELRYRHADGSWRLYECHLAVFARGSDGHVRQVIGTATDITERRRAEEELHRLNAELEQRVAARTAELIAVNRELEAFADSVSHDLRAPLRAIDGFSGALLDNIGAELPQEAHHYVERIRAGTQRMRELIDSLLGLSRVTRSEFTVQRVDLSALAEAVISDLRRVEPGRDVDIVIAAGVTATGDARLLRIVLDNLLSNAWKFTSRRERARVEFGVRHDVPCEPTYYVRDNGAGFDMERAAHKLFVPFQRLHSAEAFSGTGLGLATVRRIITRHGGRIWADSAPGAGATFSFTLGSNVHTCHESEASVPE
jgi:PAS domain S-box-containing protein